MSETRNVDTPAEREGEKKNHRKRNYIISLLFLVLLTAGSLLFAFYGAGNGDIAAGWNQIVDAIASANIWWLVGIMGIMVVSYLLDGLVLYVFARLYTRRYHFYQGCVVGLIGAFYNNVTPSASGGQPMQAYIMKTQGLEISNAASIMVMWFICYQISLISLDVVAILVEWEQIMSITSFAIPGIRIGFGLSNPDIISEMEKVRMTWNVGQIEQTVATVLLRDKMDYVDHAAAVMAEESEIMNSSLEEIGFPAGPVSDSFFYFNSLEPLGMDAADFNKRMLRHGIMVRDCSSFGEDFRGYVRYSVKDRERNCRFIAAVDAVING